MLRSSTDLKGFEIPRCEDKVIASLFVDDTAAFLSESDNLSDLLYLLHKWCQASSAKFNAEKTEIIPVGSVEYRAQVLQSHCLNPNDTDFPDSTRVLANGESVHYLWAHIGNHTNNSEPWLPLIEKIESILGRCLEFYPTIEAKCYQAQLTIGAITQYMTQANGMPTYITKWLQKIQSEFL
ncbi:hypothetical protein GYMLUDRAFT_128438, partial [Collybiopsis luxurians FD-317 M1]